MLALRRGRGCRRRLLPSPTAGSSPTPATAAAVSWQRLPQRLLSSGKPTEVDAEERAAWRRQFKRPGGHHHQQQKKPPAVLARLDPAGIAVEGGGEGEGEVRRAFEGAGYELRFGDHVLVMGGNGAGKSLFWQALAGRRSLVEGKEDGGKPKQPKGDVGGSKALMFMSFNMHERFLEQHGQRVVADVLGGASDPLARRLIVTLGLYPLWYKKVAWLSTGEVRRVLLAAVLSKAPRVVVLDKPYDGLDGPSRANLRMILSQLCQGFPRLLVDLGLARRSIDRTSMVLITHRQEEAPEEVNRVVAVEGLGIEFEGPMQEHRAEVRRRLTHVFPTPEPLVQKLPRLFRPQVPRAATLSNARTRENLSTVLEFRGVSLQKGEYLILDRIGWRVRQGEIWAVKGLNGSGKSTATKLLMEAFEAQQQQQQRHHHTNNPNPTKKPPSPPPPTYEGHIGVGVPHIGWVSTEVHLSLAQRCAAWPTAQVILSGVHGYEQEALRRRRGGGGHGRSNKPSHHEADASVHPARGYHAPQPPAAEVPPALAPLLGEWAGLLDLGPAELAKPFGRLSQGQQKLALVARALIGAPSLLIVDEVCQGLDSRHRALVLSLLDTIGRTAGGGWLSMLYVTHHEDEALPCVTHVLELEKGRAAFKGTAAEYAAAAEERKAKASWCGSKKGGGGGAGKGLVQGL